MKQASKEKETLEQELSRLRKEVRKLSKEVEQLNVELQKSTRKKKEIEEQTLVFKRFAESSGQGFGMAHLDGTITYVNPALCRILDEENQENVCKKPFPEYYPPEIQKRLKEEILPTVMKEGQWTGELSVISAKGKKTPTLENFFLLRGHDGEPLFFADVITDISEQREMSSVLVAESIRESELNLRAILESSKETVFLIDTSGIILVANETTAERLGKKVDDIIGKNIIDLMPVALKEHRKQRIAEAIREKKVVRFEDQRNGIWLDSYLYPVIDDGNVTRLAVMAIDISERKKAEQFLRQNEELLRSILESIGTGILVVNDQGKVTHVNKKFSSLWRIPEEVMDSKDDDQLLGFVLDQLEEPEQFLTKVKELYQTDRVDNDILKFKDGRYFERHSHPLMLGNKVTGRVWGFRDITQRKTMEIEINRINEELQELNAAKDKFFSIIAHDLKSPFSGLLGLSEVIADPTEELTIQEMRKYSGRLHSLLRNQFNLLQNLLEWSRLQRGGIEYKPERLNLRSEVSFVTDQLAVNILRKNQDLLNEVEPRIIIHADTDMLQSILQNIISNAIKFTNQNGKIVIRAKVIDKLVEVSVEDNGVGISSNRLSTIFNLEEVNSSTGTDGEKGTGLGLLLCKEFIEKHGGTIQVESEPGKGSIFRFTIPAE
ncbi:MAG: PAS domain-containing sensor histidine kinase [Bacteroidales bacterium]|nr:PAS domain-containing sensor histidine kinase [Bacteroidota bacterium]MBL6949149.1 PAS domain-containing sensor histidine kinase [Bacteroidales bacterium]